MELQRVGHDWATELNWTEFASIHEPNIPGSYAILFFIVSDIIFITRYIHTWTLFPVWLSLFILSGAISALKDGRVQGRAITLGIRI